MIYYFKKYLFCFVQKHQSTTPLTCINLTDGKGHTVCANQRVFQSSKGRAAITINGFLKCVAERRYASAQKFAVSDHRWGIVPRDSEERRASAEEISFISFAESSAENIAANPTPKWIPRAKARETY